MAMTVKEVREWLMDLDDADLIGIDGGGLTLIVIGSTAYLELGGVPTLD